MSYEKEKQEDSHYTYSCGVYVYRPCLASGDVAGAIESTWMEVSNGIWDTMLKWNYEAAYGPLQISSRSWGAWGGYFWPRLDPGDDPPVYPVWVSALYGRGCAGGVI